MRRITALSFGLSILLFALPLLAEKEETAEEHAEWIKANYTKYEYMIPMRDGMKLFTSVYAPKDDTQPYPIMLYRTPYSVRPYDINAYKTRIGPSRQFAKDLFIFAYQDVRGRMGSEGEFVNVRPYKEIKNGPEDIDETTDAYDTIDWLVKNIPNNNGKVGQWGISYPGFYTAMGAIDAHPALKAASPQAPVADWFIGDDFHHNGAFYLAHAFRFFWRFGMPIDEPTREAPKQFDFKTFDGYEFYLNLGPLTNLNEKYFKNKVPFWNEMMKHPNYDDYWKERDLRRGLKDIKPAVMTVGGWFDAEDLFGPLKVYESIEKNSPGAYNILVMGPWYHGQWANHDGDKMGHVPFNAKTSLFYREEIELPFFRHFLKDVKELDLPEAYVFELGTNQWRRYDSWPPKQVTEKRLYFHPDGKLSFESPSESGSTAFDEYVSDPAKPVPFIPNIAIGMTREHMLDDQRFASSRTDVLVYKTDVLEEDITIAGPITPRLHVSTTGTDSDWVVKLIDVYSSDFPNPKPNPERVQMGGYQQLACISHHPTAEARHTTARTSLRLLAVLNVPSSTPARAKRLAPRPDGPLTHFISPRGEKYRLVRGEAMRGRYRNSFEKPEPFQPGKVTKVEYVMPDAYHTFRRGHRIMVHVQSSWFPLVDRNPQKFVDIYNAKKKDFQKATQRVYRSKQAPSVVRLTVLPPRKP